MSHIFQTPYRKIKLPKSRTEEAEFGKEKKGLLICKTCGAYHYQKSWHHDAKSFLKKREGKRIIPQYAECPACAMVRHGLFEGRIIISAIPGRYWSELSSLIKGYCRRAQAKDPLDRLIALTKKGDTAVVTVTENQLAAKLARKIKDVFNRRVKISIRYSHEPSDVGTATVVFE